jgi:hypothetical protein
MDGNYRGHKIHISTQKDPAVDGWTWIATIRRNDEKNHRLYGALKKHDSKEEADKEAMLAAMKWIDDGKAGLPNL